MDSASTLPLVGHEALVSPALLERRQRADRLRLLRRAAVAGALVLLGCLGLLGLVFAGSPARLAEGVQIASVDVGGLTVGEATRLLERRFDAVSETPVTFVAGSRSWRIAPAQLGVDVNWAAAVAAAEREGDGFGPVRGFRRLQTRFFGADVAPPTRVSERSLTYAVERFARAIDVRPREAAVELRGLGAAVVPGRPGRSLARRAAEGVIVRSLASFGRAPVGLPVRVDRPRVVAADLIPVVNQVRTAVSAPIRLAHGPTRWRVPRWRIAKLLSLPRAGATTLAVAGPEADRYFERLGRAVNEPPVPAEFAIADGGAVSVVPSRAGFTVDAERTADALLAAALAPGRRIARLAVETRQPERTTAKIRSLGITGLVGGYTTIYGGEPNRLHNVRLVAELIDGKLIAPGATFSFNRTTGERTAEKGFLEAPVIINGELQNGLGGGVCQVSTTVFNAAYEAGLGIDSRTNHALYISHYPLGRDATVNYPDLDLRFTNDTKKWLLLRTFVGSSALTVNLYGVPANRRVVTETAPLAEIAPPPISKIEDPSLLVGQSVLVESGQPARTTSVQRLVYDDGGKLLHDSTWQSYYRGEARVIRVGSKPKPKPKPKPKAKKVAAAPAPTPAIDDEVPVPSPTEQPPPAEIPPPPPAAATPLP